MTTATHHPQPSRPVRALVNAAIAAAAGVVLVVTGIAARLVDSIAGSATLGPWIMGGALSVIVGLAAAVAAHSDTIEAFLNRERLTDDLTGLLNRQGLNEVLEHEFARAAPGDRRLLVALIDLRRFEDVNAMFGRDVGDLALATIAARLTELAGGATTVVRHGGDEFAAVSTDAADVVDPGRLAIRLLGAFSSPIEIQSFTVGLDANVGVAVVDPAEADAEAALRSAEVALFRSQRQGPGAYEVFDRSDAHEVSPAVIVSWIRGQLGTQRIHLDHQPIFSLTDGSVFGFESLLRWDHPTLGLLPPSVVLPALETSGLIVDVGGWVIDEVAALQAALGDDDTVPVAFVNVSVRQLIHPGFVPTLQRAIAEHRVPARRWCLEVHGDVASATFGPVCAVLRECDAQGIRVALDRFGDVGTDLAMVRQAPVSFVKLDRHLISASGGPADRTLARHLVAACADLGIAVVADGIEHPDHAEVAQQLGCSYVQGNYFASPRGASELSRLLGPPDRGTGSPRRRRVADDATGRLRG